MTGTNHGGAADRAFVVQFMSDDARRAGELSGRVEHVASGESTRFDSLEQLADFLVRKLGREGRAK